MSSARGAAARTQRQQRRDLSLRESDDGDMSEGVLMPPHQPGAHGGGAHRAGPVTVRVTAPERGARGRT